MTDGFLSYCYANDLVPAINISSPQDYSSRKVTSRKQPLRFKLKFELPREVTTV